VDVTSTQFVARVVARPSSDRFGGTRVTQVSGIGLLVCTLLASRYVAPDSINGFTSFLWGMLELLLFAGIGDASMFKQIPMVFPQHQSAGVIGWTDAIAAYGPFVFGVLIGAVSASIRLAARILPGTCGVLRDQHRSQPVLVRPRRGEDAMLIPTH